MAGEATAWSRFLTAFDARVLPCLPDMQRRMRTLAMSRGDAPNLLFYGAPGFPYAPLWSMLAAGAPAAALQSSPAVWANKLPYRLHDRFFYFNMLHPDMPSDGTPLIDFLCEVASARAVHGGKHVVVLEHIDVLATAANAPVLKMLLERHSQHTWFIATTHRAGAMEAPLRSRFLCVRVPLPSEAQNADIAAALGLPSNALPTTRNTSLLLWHADHPASAVADATYRYPPLRPFFRRQHTLQQVRDMATALCKDNVPLRDVALDALTAMGGGLLEALADLEHRHCGRRRGRDAVYFELALHLGLEPLYEKRQRE
jgi:hypothetical protein